MNPVWEELSVSEQNKNKTITNVKTDEWTEKAKQKYTTDNNKREKNPIEIQPQNK